MIYYRPTDGDPFQAALTLRPRTCFLMTQIGRPLPPDLSEIHDSIQSVCDAKGYTLTDAASVVTGKDFLLNIWFSLLSVPVGIAIVHEDMGAQNHR